MRQKDLVLQDLTELTLGRLNLWLFDLLGAQLLSRVSLGVRVQSQQNLLVLQWVLLQDVGSLLSGLASRSNDFLDFSRVDQSGDIGVGDDVRWQGVVGLDGLGGVGTVDRVQGFEGTLGPDDESTQVSTRGQLQQAQVLDVGGFDTWDVSQGLDKTVVLGVDDQWTSSLGESSTSQLTLTGSQLLGLDDLDNVLVGTDGLQDGNGVLGLGDGLEVVGDDQRQFLDLFNSVTSGQNQRGDGRGSDGRGSGITLLVMVDLDVPLSPSLGWSEHTTTTTHVTESSLTGTVGTTTTDSWDSGNSSTGTPGFGGGLVTGLLGDGVCLSLVLVDSDKDRVDQVWSDWSREDNWQKQLSGGLFTLGGDDRNLWTSRHR